MAAVRTSPGRALRGFLQVAFGLSALTVFFWRIDVGEVLAHLASVEIGWALLALLIFTASKLLHGWRWWVFLGRAEVPRVQLMAVFLLSNMANALLPLRAGDLLRVEVPSRRFGIPRSTLVSSVFVVESVLDLFVFAILLVVALFLADLPVVLRPLVGLIGLAAIVLFGAVVVLARARKDLAAIARRVLRPLPERLSEGVAGRLPAFVDGMASLRTNRQAARVVAVSLAAWLVEVVVYWLLARAFHVDLGVSQALILMIAANLIVSLPLTPWSIGPYELVVTEALVVLGAGRVEAGAFALGSHLMLQAWIGITGTAAMLWLRLGWRDLLPGRHTPPPAPGEL